MSPLRVLRGFIFGALGGLLGWILTEFLPFPYPFQPARYEGPGMVPPQVGLEGLGLVGLALGLAIGGFLGLSEGMAEGTASRFRRALFTFLGLGAIGGFLGLYCGQALYSSLGGTWGTPSSPQAFLYQVLARSLGWMLIGVFLGLIFGVPQLSVRRMWNGAVGGAIGGFLGGFFFQTLTTTAIFQAMQARFIGYTLLGAMIGFFINLIAEVTKRVWVKVLIGRNEGREHELDAPIAYVGRDELADIPVFLDPAVPKRIASFRITDGRYALYPESQALPILLNGEALAPGRVLRDGDAIQFGRVTLGYNEKASMTGLGRPVDSIPLADMSVRSVVPGATPIPTAANVCEFCGQARDPATGACACTVPEAAGYAPGGYDAGAYAQPGYAPDYGGGYAPQPDPAYGATMMDPGPAGGYAPVDAGGPRLVATNGPFAGQVFPLMTADVGIGRDPSQDISVNGDSTASRRHARLTYGANGWILRDEGSSNGTWINGVRIQEQPLFP
ncbi:MAG TPA: FHA domain-containing protein, partial [Armatimonadota bacterium]|nr:FHA domain-containing protein [Armatimonadota bacterium]